MIHVVGCEKIKKTHVVNYRFRKKKLIKRVCGDARLYFLKDDKTVAELLGKCEGRRITLVEGRKE